MSVCKTVSPIHTLFLKDEAFLIRVGRVLVSSKQMLELHPESGQWNDQLTEFFLISRINERCFDYLQLKYSDRSIFFFLY